MIFISDLSPMKKPLDGREEDFVDICWWDVYKRIWRLTSKNGRDIAIRLINPPTIGLCNGDLLYEDDKVVIFVRILPQKSLCFYAHNNFDLVQLAYEIGNRHVALFFNQKEDRGYFRTPYEQPIAKILERLGLEYEVRDEILDGRTQLRLSQNKQKPLWFSLSRDFTMVLER